MVRFGDLCVLVALRALWPIGCHIFLSLFQQRWLGIASIRFSRRLVVCSFSGTMPWPSREAGRGLRFAMVSKRLGIYCRWGETYQCPDGRKAGVTGAFCSQSSNEHSCIILHLCAQKKISQMLDAGPMPSSNWKASCPLRRGLEWRWYSRSFDWRLQWPCEVPIVDVCRVHLQVLPLLMRYYSKHANGRYYVHSGDEDPFQAAWLMWTKPWQTFALIGYIASITSHISHVAWHRYCSILHNNTLTTKGHVYSRIKPCPQIALSEYIQMNIVIYSHYSRWHVYSRIKPCPQIALSEHIQMNSHI